MKIELNNLKLGHSELTDTIYAGILNKKGNMWLQKVDVTNYFLDCVIRRWENQKEKISTGDHEWEISVKKIKSPKNHKK